MDDRMIRSQVRKPKPELSTLFTFYFKLLTYMATCGYICPSCEGKGYNEKGDKCEWCSVEEKKPNISGEDGEKKNQSNKKDNKNDTTQMNF